MFMRMRIWIPFVAALLFASFPGGLDAAVGTLSPGVALQVTFTSVTNTSDLLFFYNADSLTVTGSPIITTQLFNGPTLLASVVGPPLTYLGNQFYQIGFRSPASIWNLGLTYVTTTALTSIQDGTIVGTLKVTVSGGSISGFDMAHFHLYDAVGLAAGSYTPQTHISHTPITIASPALRYVPVTPCRLADTRTPTYGPFLASGTSRDFNPTTGPCGIPVTAQAFSVNVAVVPHGALGFLTVWPAGENRPTVATLNSVDGRTKSDAAILPAGANGAISVYATNDTDVVLDINGYFVAATDPSALAFYPVPPCRLVDTRTNLLSGGALAGGTSRTLPILTSTCAVPATAQAYSLNFVAVPPAPVGFLTAYRTGIAQPRVATLNALTGTVTANAAIVQAGTNGSIDVFASNTTDLVVDINGYFAPAGVGGLSLYTVPPCRAIDTRQAPSTSFVGSIDLNALSSTCAVTSAVRAYVLNSTVVPPGALGFLTLWPQGSPRPTVSTLNALDAAITNNMAIVPSNNTQISAYASNLTHMILDLFAYFAP